MNFSNKKCIAIVGSRNINNYSIAKIKIEEVIYSQYGDIDKKDIVIISGGAIGADNIAEQYANDYNIPIRIFKPDWSIGRHAGFVRNKTIVDNCDIVIALWDKKSSGTKHTINEAKKEGKSVFIVDLLEGVRVEDDNYIFDFKEDKKDDILKLKFNKDYVVKRVSKGVVSYFTYKLNKKINKGNRYDLLLHIKNQLGEKEFNSLLNKSVIGLYNNPYLNVGSTDIILIPELAGKINISLAQKIKAKIPYAIVVDDAIVKSFPNDIRIDYDKVKDKKLSDKLISSLEKMVERAIDNGGGTFKMKYVPPQFRDFVIDFLTINNQSHKELINRATNGNIIVVDDIRTSGATLKEAYRLLEKNFNPKSIILFSLIGT
jgi:phosphoribosylpyrophosphate synthetase